MNLIEISRVYKILKKVKKCMVDMLSYEHTERMGDRHKVSRWTANCDGEYIFITTWDGRSLSIHLGDRHLSWEASHSIISIQQVIC